MVDVSFLFMVFGFLLAAWSVISNDSLQTLGTFLASQQKIKWYWLFLSTASIMVIVLTTGWYLNGGDISFGRLDSIPYVQDFSLWHVLAPLTLLFLTRFGIPVSTTFLVLSVFATNVVLTKMIFKSALGYGLAFVSAFLIWTLLSKFINEHLPIKDETHKKYWRYIQWFSTMFLWSQWLMHDMANIAVFLPRSLDLISLILILATLCIFLGIMFYTKGGKIQQIVLSKTGARYARSAAIIDIIFGILLLVLKVWSNIPMSTTWVFVGLLAGREIAIYHQHRKRHKRVIFPMLIKDFLKVMAGLGISVIIAIAATGGI